MYITIANWQDIGLQSSELAWAPWPDSHLYCAIFMFKNIYSLKRMLMKFFVTPTRGPNAEFKKCKCQEGTDIWSYHAEKGPLVSVPMLLSTVTFPFSHLPFSQTTIREEETSEGPHTLSSLGYTMKNISLYWEMAKTTQKAGDWIIQAPARQSGDRL